MVDRHDDELAERRATGPKRERAAGGAAATTGAGGGALPLQWADQPEDPVVGDTFPSPGGAEEADSDVAPGTSGQMAATIDLTGRAERARGDDLDVWSDVLRRRPAEAARLTGHPSAAGERIAAAAARRRPPAQGGREREDEFARALLNPPRRDGGDETDEDEGGGATAPAGNVSRLRPVPPERASSWPSA